jgi:hypothetical protein
MRRIVALTLTVLAIGALARAPADAASAPKRGPMSKPWNGKRVGDC